MINMTIEVLFNKWAKAVEGQLCWGFVGVSAGSMFSLEIGRKLKKTTPTNNSMLKEELRNYSGEYVLFTRSSLWVLRDLATGKVITHCNDDNSIDGPMQKSLEALEGELITGANFDKNNNNLKIVFDSDTLLSVSGKYPEDCFGYTLSFPNEIVALDEEGFHREIRKV